MDLKTMDLKTIIELISIFATLIISIISIVIAVKSLKLTRKSIEDANRPYVVSSIETSVSFYIEKYLLIKNYGNTAAKIKSINFSETIDNQNLNRFIHSIEGAYIAPNQSYEFSLRNLGNNISLVGNMEIEYEDDLKKYNNVSNLTTKVIAKIETVTSTNKNDFENELLNTFHNLIKKK